MLVSPIYKGMLNEKIVVSGLTKTHSTRIDLICGMSQSYQYVV